MDKLHESKGRVLEKKARLHRMNSEDSTVELDVEDVAPHEYDDDDEYVEFSNVTVIMEMDERPIWWIHALMVLCALIALALVGIECSMNEECNKAVPTLDYLIESGNRLSILIVLAINWLTALHGITAFILWFLFRKGQRGVGRLQLLLAILFQVSVYAALLLANYWFVSIFAVTLFTAWQAVVVLGGLRKLYHYKTSRKLYRLAVAAMLFTIMGAIFYLAFQSTPQLDFAGKRQAVLASEVLLLTGGVGFMTTMVLLCRHVRYRIRSVN